MSRRIELKDSVVYVNSEGELHRLDGPALERKDGLCVWYKNGKRHRIDGPAVIDEKIGISRWYFDDKLHRVAGPAYDDRTYKIYYVDGELSRLDGPVNPGSLKPEWRLDGHRHRITPSHAIPPIINGKKPIAESNDISNLSDQDRKLLKEKLKEEEKKKYIIIKDKTFLKEDNNNDLSIVKTNKIPKKGKYFIKDKYEIKHYLNGKLHNDGDAPAKITLDGKRKV